MNDGHFIDDPLYVVNVEPDFSGIGMEPIHINKGTMTDEQKQATRDRIGQRIAELRKTIRWTDAAGINRTGMKQTDLAERCGLSQSHIARIERGMYNFQLDTLSQIAEALGCRIDFVEK